MHVHSAHFLQYEQAAMRRAPAPGSMTRNVASLLRLEGLAVLGLAVAAYASLDASWLLFALLLLVPDVSMIGYLKDPRLGARTYNAVHTYVGPAVLGAAAWAGTYELTGAIALIWAAHIGMDRMLGFGLKYPSAFGDTHLGTGAD